MKKNVLYLFLIFSIILQTKAQTSNNKVIMIPEKEYAAGWFYELFLGSHWRDVWATPVEVEILDLNKYDGGLTAYKKGGGFQTLSLRLKSKSGRVWKFRSLNKNPEKLLPEALQKSIVADILKDQISSSNPYAALIVVPILDSVGILHNPASLYLMPDDPQLGEFRDEFGGILGMIELHPDEEDDAVPGYPGAVDEKGTLDLWDRLEKKRSEKIDAKEFLKARLVDHFLGDWDRHTDQWKWVKYEENGDEIWRPIPRDRDQPFSKFTGLLPSIAEYLEPQLNTFDYDYPSIHDLSWNARYMDRRILPVITKQEWDSVAIFVHERLTDAAIEKAVLQMPPEIDPRYGQEISDKLKSRREKFIWMSDDYYRFVNTVVDVYCSDERDYVEVNRLSDNLTEVVRYKRDKDNGEKKEAPLYYKLFDNEITDEIRIYLGEDDDFAIVKGNVSGGPLVRIIGGEGKDELIDSSDVNGYWAVVTPLPDAENKTRFYDYGNGTIIQESAGTVYDDTKIPPAQSLSERYEPSLKDRGNDVLIVPLVSANEDDGIIFGVGYNFEKYNFRADPFDYKLQIFGEFATAPSTGSLELSSEFNSMVKGAKVKFSSLLSGLRYTKYFGKGNETPYDKELDDDNFYRMKENYVSVNSSIETKIFENSIIGAGVSYEYSDTKLVNPVITMQKPTAEYGLGKFQLAGVSSFFIYDTRDNNYLPNSGFYFNLNAEAYPAWFENEKNFGKSEVDLRTYFTQNTFTDITYAARLFGGRVWGSHPFFKGIFIGGSESLRGFARERFLGDSGMFGQFLMRAYLTKVKLIINGDLGILGTVQSGRTFIDGDNSELWHTSYGGGVWLSYLDRTFNITLTLTNSAEGFYSYFGSSIGF